VPIELFLRLEKFLFGARGKSPVGRHLIAGRGDGQRHQQKIAQPCARNWCLQWHDAVN
jgi:hypothetical protein